MKNSIVFILISCWSICTSFSQEKQAYIDIDTEYLYYPPNDQLSKTSSQILSGPILSLYMGYAAQKYGEILNDSSLSNIELKDRSVRIFVVNPTNESDTLYQIDLRIYSPSKVGRRWNRMVIIRPYDKVVRPCILYTHGNSGNLNTWHNYYLIGVSEMLMRGYAVAFYENYNNSFFTSSNATDVVYKTWVHENLMDSTQVLPEDHILQRGHYLLYQYGYAAQAYLSYIAQAYHIDENMIFTAGHSAGGLSSMMLTFADPKKNFQHPIFEYCGPYDIRNYPDLNVKRIPIKGVLSSAAGLQDDQVKGSYFGNYINEGNSDKTAVMIHGKQDPLAPVDYGKALWANFVDTVKMMGPLSLHSKMNESGIKNFSFINCNGKHGVYNYPNTSTDNSGLFRNLDPFSYDADMLKDSDFNLDTSFYQVQLFQQQLTKIMGNVAAVFSNIYQNKTIDLPSAIYTWHPNEYLPKADSLGLILDWTATAKACGIDAKIEDFDLNPISTNQILQKKSLLIYPNPAQNILKIKGTDKYHFIKIMDVNGKVCYSSEINYQDNLRIDLSHLNSGVYILMLFDSTYQRREDQKFIVIK